MDAQLDVVIGPPSFTGPGGQVPGRLVPIEEHPRREELAPEFGQMLSPTAPTLAELAERTTVVVMNDDEGNDEVGLLDDSPSDPVNENTMAAEDYEDMRRDDLLALAESRGLDVRKGDTKAVLIEALVDADENQG